MRTDTDSGKYVHTYIAKRNLTGINRFAKKLGSATAAYNTALKIGLERMELMAKKQATKKVVKKTTPKKKK